MTKRLAAAAALLLASGLGGCAAVSVVGATASVVSTGVGAAASVGSTAVSVTGGAVKATAGAAGKVLSTSDEEPAY